MSQEDYELGKLAEELISFRYAEKLEEKDKTIKELREKLSDSDRRLAEEKERKVYYVKEEPRPVSVYTRWDIDGRDYYTAIDGDKLTEELKTISELKDKLQKENDKLNSFVGSSWLTKLLYKNWSK